METITKNERKLEISGFDCATLRITIDGETQEVPLVNGSGFLQFPEEKVLPETVLVQRVSAVEEIELG